MNDLINKARSLGTEKGKAAGSWEVDGNTPHDALVAIIDDETYFDELRTPLSGEFAGDYLLSDLLADLDIDMATDPVDYDELATAFEDAFLQAYIEQAQKDAIAMFPSEPGDDNPDEPISLNFGEVEPELRTDEDGEHYLFVPLTLPDGMLAEIDDDTFGTLHGFRIYPKADQS